MEIMLRYKAESKNLATRDERKALYRKALQEAISKNILADYLTRKGTEVINMFDGEYDYELDIQAKTEDAREEGIATGLAQGQEQKAIEDAERMLRKEYPVNDISEITGLPMEKVLDLQKEIKSPVSV
jgi:predicted transposase/invertase (TIGR01784 family)